ncbi:MAG: phosphodiester glycosidase family protein [Akkermansiaceae bacterium]|nr:phosphodiester glycosidase family protein [Akkermansiaceae bacterium]MCP5542609.1 phosphodiester glycosidase family protein [Akkermansiaceae bacterium]MCP5548278.1 phosphodiester glycosidase family protein [Akkermansiaceae bacterium]
MRIRFLMRGMLATAMAGAACSTSTPPVAENPAAQPEKAIVMPPPAPRIGKPVSAPSYAAVTRSGIRFSGVEFDSRSHRLVVIDQAGGPGTKYPDAGAAARSRNALAAVNAGFFTPEGDPLGLVVEGGVAAGSWNQASSLGSGIWYEDAPGGSAIARRGAIGREGAKRCRELLQTGPLLVENGAAVGGLSTRKTSARTIIAWDGGDRWWIGRTSPCTLQSAAAALASGGPCRWSVAHALNLDGGRSSELWVSGKVSGGPVSERPLWNRPVRNFLALAPR